MTSPIVLAFDTEGTVEYTRNASFVPYEGRGEMQRVTDIKKEPYGQRFYIHWMLGPWAGVDHTRTIARSYFNPDELLELTYQGLCPTFSPEYQFADAPMLFDSYEGAVKHEIVMLNAMRKAGVSFYDKEA